MNKVLITGGAGFIGSYLCERSLQLENDVIIIDNLSKASGRDTLQSENHNNLTIVQADLLSDGTKLQDALDECSIVYHLAANPDVRIGAENSVIDFEQNILATYRLLEGMKRSKTCKKIIFASTSTVYGDAKIMPTPESYSPLHPISLYASTKLACEAMICGYCNMFEMSGISLRLANIVGKRSDHGIIHDFTDKLSQNPSELEILGDGGQTKSYLHVDDCVEAFVLVAQKVKSTFEVFNVGSPDKISVNDIAKILVSQMGLQNVNFRYRNELLGRGWKGDVKDMVLDCTKLMQLGWKSNYNSKESIIRTISEKLSTK